MFNSFTFQAMHSSASRSRFEIPNVMNTHGEIFATVNNKSGSSRCVHAFTFLALQSWNVVEINILRENGKIYSGGYIISRVRFLAINDLLFCAAKSSFFSILLYAKLLGIELLQFSFTSLQFEDFAGRPENPVI